MMQAPVVCRIGAPAAMALFALVGTCTLVEHGWKFAELRNGRHFTNAIDLRELRSRDTCTICNVTYNIHNDKFANAIDLRELHSQDTCITCNVTYNVHDDKVQADFLGGRVEYVDEHAIPVSYSTCSKTPSLTQRKWQV